MIALGANKIILIGGVGSLKREIKRWDIILPTAAIRDEGTSYHYAQPSFFAYPDESLVKAIEIALRKRGVPYFKGITWTTDALFRETHRKRKLFMSKGAISVDMEAAALFSVAKFRGVKLAALFCAGDLVAEEWDSRYEEDIEEKTRKMGQNLLELALEALYIAENAT